jgi:hypothetical protein
MIEVGFLPQKRTHEEHGICSSRVLVPDLFIATCPEWHK